MVENENDGWDSLAIGALLSGGFALKLLSDRQQIMSFIEQHKIDKSKLLPGFKLLFDTLIENQKLQIRLLARDYIGEDLLTTRAITKDFPLEKISSNSNLAKLLRGIENQHNAAIAKDNLTDFLNQLERGLGDWFQSIDNLSKIVKIKHTSRIWKKTALKLYAFDWFLTLINIRYQVDVLLDKSPIDKEMLKDSKNKKAKKQDDKKFEGYRIGVAYIWSMIHHQSIVENPSKIVMNTNTWESLDDAFMEIAHGPLKQIEKIVGDVDRDVRFRFSSKIDSYLPQSLMLGFPLYKPTSKELLDIEFLWYEFEVIDGASPKIFPGVPSFIPTLVGLVTQYRIHDNHDKIEVRRILHPTDYDEKKHTISYALLITSYGTFGSDFSGWLLYLDSATDHSNFGGSMWKHAESIIEEYKEYLNVREFKIPLEDLESYTTLRLDERRGRPFSYLSKGEHTRTLLRDSIKASTNLIGRILELIMATTMVEQGYHIKWQFRNKRILGGSEIDVLACNDNEIHIIECSKTLPLNKRKISSTIKEMKKKIGAIKNSQYTRPTIRYRLITLQNSSSKEARKSLFELSNAGIEVESIFDVLKRSNHKVKPLMQLLSDSIWIEKSSGRTLARLKKEFNIKI